MKAIAAIPDVIAATSIRPLSTPRAEQRVAEPAADEYADHRAEPEHEDQQVGQRLVDPVLLMHQLRTEGLHAGEVEVAAGARDDHHDVGPDRQDVAGRGVQAHPARVSDQDVAGVGRNPLLP